MRKMRFTQRQIVGILRELDAGTTATELGRKQDIHANTIHSWKDRHGGLDTSDLIRLKQLEDENRREDRIIARLSLEVDAMKGLVEKTAGALAAAKNREGLEERGISIVRACQLAGYNRSNLYYRRKQHDDPALKARMHELAQERPRWAGGGYSSSCGDENGMTSGRRGFCGRIESFGYKPGPQQAQAELIAPATAAVSACDTFLAILSLIESPRGDSGLSFGYWPSVRL